MTKGKPWPTEDERKLKDWFASGTTDLSALVFTFEGRYTKEAIRQKLMSFGFLKEHQLKKFACCSSKLELPEGLPSIEEALKMLVGTLKALDEPGLDKTEIFRLRGIISGYKIYQELFSNYVNYRQLEVELVDLRLKYEDLKKTKGV